jgi:hypothetical protein
MSGLGGADCNAGRRNYSVSGPPDTRNQGTLVARGVDRAVRHRIAVALPRPHIEPLTHCTHGILYNAGRLAPGLTEARSSCDEPTVTA